MAASRLTQSAYEAAKKAAELDGVSAVAFISQAVLKAARERIALALDEIRAKDISGEIATIKARRDAQIADLASFVEQPKPKNKPKREKVGDE